MTTAILILVALMFVLFLPAASMSSRLEEMLRERHPDAWKQLQKPLSWRERVRLRSPRLAIFVRSGEFKSLSDPGVDLCCRQLRLFQRLFAVGFWTIIGLVVLTAIISRRG
jgi:hypothetical protein